MFTRLGFRGFGWPSFERELALLDEYRRHVNRLFEGSPRRGWLGQTADPIRTNVYDTADEYVITADVPGMTSDDVKVTLQNDVLSIAGERKVTAPEGYSVHRQERPTFSFSRSYSLPSSVDAEKAAANVSDGVLTIRLAKSPEVRPRQIEVKS